MQIVCEENGKSTACTMVFHFFALRIELVAAVAVTATIVKLFDPTYIIMSANVTDSEETDPAETDPAPTANRELDSASYEHLVALKKKKNFDGDNTRVGSKRITGVSRYSYDATMDCLKFDGLPTFINDDNGDNKAFAYLFQQVRICQTHYTKVRDFISKTIHCNCREFINREDRRHPRAGGHNRIAELMRLLKTRRHELTAKPDPLVLLLQQQLAMKDGQLAKKDGQLAEKDGQLAKALANGADANKNMEKLIDSTKSQAADANKNMEKLIDSSNKNMEKLIDIMSPGKAKVSTPKKTPAKKSSSKKREAATSNIVSPKATRSRSTRSATKK